MTQNSRKTKIFPHFSYNFALLIYCNELNPLGYATRFQHHPIFICFSISYQILTCDPTRKSSENLIFHFVRRKICHANLWQLYYPYFHVHFKVTQRVNFNQLCQRGAKQEIITILLSIKAFISISGGTQAHTPNASSGGEHVLDA